jgi:hypothetical protein
MKRVFWLLGALGLAGVVVVGLSFMRLSSELNYWEARHAKQQVSAKLMDPDSAQFRDLRKFSDTIYGWVNAKNSYGAYNGYREFNVESDGRVYIGKAAFSYLGYEIDKEGARDAALLNENVDRHVAEKTAPDAVTDQLVEKVKKDRDILQKQIRVEEYRKEMAKGAPSEDRVP